jgi:hypothetical protein
MATVTLPETLDLYSVLKFALELDRLKGEAALTLDMGEQRHFAPFAMLFLVAKILEFKEKNPQALFTVLNHQNHSYPAHMGFFHAVGIDYGKAIGEAGGSARYFPIRELNRTDLYQKDGDKYLEMGDRIQIHADDIAEMISRDETRKTEIFNVISYSFREMVRNVFEHSGCDRVLYCAQYWPTNQKVEVSLLDQGRGIRSSLAQNPNFRFDSDKEAIEMSLLPGVSGKTHLRTNRDSIWTNSGYGLYMTSRLARHGGNFVLASGTSAIGLSKHSKRNIRTFIRGTALRMSLNTPEIGSVKDRLDQFRKDAAEIGQKHLRVGTRNPSYMSMLLRNDFEPSQKVKLPTDPAKK